jgi:CRP/FNR family transcriptional regulator
MTRFEREGLIGLPGGRRVIVTDASALERIASG